MFLSVLLVSQIAAATPAPAPSATKVLGSGTTQAASTDLGSVAGKTKIDRAKADSLFRQDGSSGGVQPDPQPTAGPLGTLKRQLDDSSREAARWRARSAQAREALEKARSELQAAEQRFPNAAYGTLSSGRVNAWLEPFRQRVVRAQAAVDALPEECRRAGCQPGWIR